MRAIKSALVIAACIALSSHAHAQNHNDANASLLDVVEVLSQIEDTICTVDRDAALQGAIAQINALPQRAGQAPLQMASPSINAFGDAYTTAFNQGLTTKQELQDAAIWGMLHSVDPTSDFFDQGAAYSGDVMVSLDYAGNTPTIIRVIPDGPAARAGLLNGDVITAVDDRSVANERVSQIVSRIRGREGTSVSITVSRQGAAQQFQMVRERATQGQDAALEWRMEGDVAVISMLTFPEHSADALGQAIRDIRERVRSPRGYIIDLRDNTGGLLDQVFLIADQFVDGGTIAFTRPVTGCSDDQEQRWNVRRGDETRGARLVVLVNGNTSSGAELVAASLRERRGAILVGQTTNGRGRVHTVIPIHVPQVVFIKLTTGMLVTPAGVSWDGVGVTPDVAVEETATGDTALARALDILRQ